MYEVCMIEIQPQVMREFELPVFMLAFDHEVFLDPFVKLSAFTEFRPVTVVLASRKEQLENFSLRGSRFQI